MLNFRNEMKSKNIVVVGAAGFAGVPITKRLLEKGYRVYAIVRPGSEHNSRLNISNRNLHIIKQDVENLLDAEEKINEPCDALIYLACTAGRNFNSNYRNVEYNLKAVRLAKNLKCTRIVCAGSQAEYGVVPKSELCTEERILNPFTNYGAAKVAACYLSRALATELGLEWVWGCIFSLIGRYEPAGRMFPDLYVAMKKNSTFNLSSCTQNWDFLDVYDCADAFIALLEKGKTGERYNVANGSYHPLMEFTEQLKAYVNSDGIIIYGNDTRPYISLQPSVVKISEDTGWRAKRNLFDSIRDYEFNGYQIE